MRLNVKELALTLAQGSLIQYAPGIAQGAISEFLPAVKLKDFALLVNSNANLWGLLPDHNRKTITELGPRLGPLDWLDVKWLMETGKPYNTALYSALQEWPEGQEWLANQIEDIKNHIGGS